MATLNVVQLERVNGTLVPPTSGAIAVGGDVFPNSGSEFIAVTTAAGALTVNVAITKTMDGIAMPSGTRSYAISTATTTKLFGPFPPSVYNNSSGQVALTYTGTTSGAKILVLRLVPEIN